MIMQSDFQVIECGGWVRAWAPVGGDRLELLRLQAAIPGPAKITQGPMMRAEMPAGRNSGDVVCEALAQGLAVLRREPPATAKPPDRRPLLDRLQGAGAGTWSVEGESLVARSPSCRIDVGFNGAVLLRSSLADVRGISHASERALAHFALALNARLRLARASWLEEQLVLEVAVRPDDLTPRVIEKALGSIQVGTGIARKECAALLNEGIAEVYLKFHKETN